MGTYWWLNGNWVVIELRMTSTGMVTYKVVFHQHSGTLQLPFRWLNGRNISVTIFYIKWWLMINKYSLLLPVYNCLCLRESTIHILELNEVHFFFFKEKMGNLSMQWQVSGISSGSHLCTWVFSPARRPWLVWWGQPAVSTSRWTVWAPSG